MSDPETLLLRVKDRERAYRRSRRRVLAMGSFAFVSCAAMAAALSFHSRSEIRRRAEPLRAPVVVTNPEQPKEIEQPVPVLVAKSAVPRGAPKATIPATELRNFKELGSPDAPIGCEIYTDPECPPCANFWTETAPRLISEYVDTGKVKLVRRDFLMPQHRYGRVAARYANAAGLIGKYDVAFNRLIATQSIWHLDGDPESQLTAVLSPNDMEKLRKLVAERPEPDAWIARDAAAAADDHIDQTPSIVIVANGRRRKVAGLINFPALKSYLDELLVRNPPE